MVYESEQRTLSHTLLARGRIWVRDENVFRVGESRRGKM